MKILFVTMQFGRSYAQGTERYLSTLGRALCGRGHQIAFLAGDPLRQGRQPTLGERQDCDAEHEVYTYPTRGWNAVRGLSSRRLKHWLLKHRPDVVHVANPAHIGVGGIIAAYEAGIPTVVTIMDYWWICP